MYRPHVQHSIHSTVCTDLCTIQYTLYNVYRSHVQHSTHFTVCTDPTLSLTSQVKINTCVCTYVCNIQYIYIRTVHIVNMVNMVHTVHTVRTVHEIHTLYPINTHGRYTTHSTHMHLCTDLASLKRAWLELFPTNMVCMMMRQSLTMIPGNKGGNEE